ncbi:LysR family transcriptional regulator [Pantoea piersonii]|uniref:LysR family transcriptional regulator n=1 Tax=Pantoea piersonii TaxID=2364647 RepID=UPI0022F1D261|nr:LysR family transcriptional regulator [Pantoea piersonii]WBV23440.1 LysR family transcriptional regulator [Pantoea piersonii]
MDIKQLIYLCNLERERHFGRAAEASFVSQPTLSMRLKNLERELGLSLINRSNNFVGFTPEGDRVLAWAREIVSVYQGLKLEVESLKHGVNGTLRIGVMPQCSVALPELLKKVQNRYPQLNYRIAALSADQLLEALNSHTVDVGIGFFELATLRELHFQTAFLPERGVEAIFDPAQYPELVSDEPLSLAALAALPLCLSEPTRYFRRYLDMAFREAGLTPQVMVESAAILELVQSAQVGLGVLVSPVGHLLPSMLNGMAQRPITITHMARQAALVIAEPGRASPLSQHFFDEARSHLESYVVSPMA